jgi:hypothetical protein
MSAKVSTPQELEIEVVLDSVHYPVLPWWFPWRMRPMVHIPESQEGQCQHSQEGQRWHSHKGQAGRARTDNAGRARACHTGRARMCHASTASTHHVIRARKGQAGTARKGHDGTTSTGDKSRTRTCHNDKARIGQQTWSNRGSIRDTSPMCHAPLRHGLRQAIHNTLGLGSWSTVSYSVYSETDLPRSGPQLSATCQCAQ